MSDRSFDASEQLPDEPDAPDAPDPGALPGPVEPVPVSEVAVGAATVPPAKPEPTTRNVAALLATAAILAALITARASFLSSDGSGGWQRALRNEIKRSAAAQEDVRFLYQNELPIAMRVETARQQAAFLRTAAQATTGATHDRLLLEAGIYDQVVTLLAPAADLVARSDLALPNGGWDLGKALADTRNQNAALVALDPGQDLAAGDAAADKARRVTLSTVPISLGVLLGALAQPFIRWRRVLVALGAAAVAVGAVFWVAMETLA